MVKWQRVNELNHNPSKTEVMLAGNAEILALGALGFTLTTFLVGLLVAEILHCAPHFQLSLTQKITP